MYASCLPLLQITPTKTVLPAKDDYWLKPAEEEMDISALSLASGAKIETVGQVTGEAGFDAVLEQVDPAGFIPPGAPPGPEPPPDLLVAGEEVEIVEPNAQSQKLDFHPLQKVDVDIELPQPFWEASADTDQVSVANPTAGSADEAMKWLVGQMSDSFFGTPDLATGCPTPKSDSTRIKTSGFVSRGEGLPFCPPDYNGGLETTEVDASVAGLESVPVSAVDGNSQLSNDLRSTTKVQTDRSNGQEIDQEVVEMLNITSVQATDSDKSPTDVGVQTLRTTRNPKASGLNGEGASDPAPVGLPIVKERPFKKDHVGGSKRSISEGLVAVPSGQTPARELTGSNPLRKLISEEKAVKSEEAVPVDADTAVAIDQPAGEAARDGSRSHDKKASTKSEWSELTSAKRSVEPLEFEKAKLDVDKKIDLSSAVTTAIPELKKPSLKPEEAELVVKQVADKLHMLAAARPRNGVTIHLNPDDLGSITVVIKSVGRMVDTQITASDARVSEALDQNRSRLVEAMDSKGFQLQSVTVSQQGGHSTQQDSSSKNWQQANQEQSQRQNQSGQQNSHRGQSDRQFDPPKANIRAWVRRGEGVDLAI